MPSLPNSLQTQGVLLFLFIPVVLVLFVQHPEPIAISLGAGVFLMLSHRLLARPYMKRALAEKCLWCNRATRDDRPTTNFLFQTRGGPLTGTVCVSHVAPVQKYFSCLDRLRWVLGVGIFLPLLALLLSLLLASLGGEVPLDRVTAWFRVLVGITVNIAAVGYLWVPERPQPLVPFPAHNFTLLGVRSLLWIFRLVGIWWIVIGLYTLTA